MDSAYISKSIIIEAIQSIAFTGKAVKFCGEYEHFILPVVRFAVAFIAFITIDLNIGYMAKISSMLVALLLALVCALLPVNAILWIATTGSIKCSYSPQNLTALSLISSNLFIKPP